MCVCPVKDGKVIKFRLLVLGNAEYLLGDLETFFFVRHGFHYPYFVAFLVFRESLFGYLLLVPADDTVRRVHDGGRGAIVLFQFAELVAGVVVSEIQNVLDTGAPERINTLRVVPDHAYILVLFREFLDNKVLRVIGILILVDQNVIEFLLVFFKYFREVTEQYIGLQQQIVKIHDIALAAS